MNALRQTDDHSNTSLVRRLGTTTATLLTAGMIIGTGIFGATGAATSKAGSGILLAMGLGGLVCLFTGISAAQLGVNYPKQGGAFTWARQFNHKRLGFVAGTAYLGKAIFSLSVISLAFAEYTVQLFPGIPTNLVAAVAMIVMLFVNMLDISMTAKVVISLMTVNVSLFGVYVALAVPSANPAHLANPIGQNGLVGLLAGAAIFFWTWDGFMRTAIMAGEIKDPRRTIPRAVIGGIGIAAVVFLIVGGVTLSVLGPVSMGADNVPLYRAGLQAAGLLGGAVVLLTAWTASVTELVGDLLAASRVAYAMGEAGELPNWLGTIHTKRRVPRNAVIALGLFVVGLVLLFDLRSLLAVASVFTLVWYLITHFSATRLEKRQRLTTPLFTWLGIAGCVLLFVSLPWWAIATGLLVLALATGIRQLILLRG
jgi:basic amino acid/polyamine antiporter, APA family